MTSAKEVIFWKIHFWEPVDSQASSFNHEILNIEPANVGTSFYPLRCFLFGKTSYCGINF